jgi:hypothetical protein
LKFRIAVAKTRWIFDGVIIQKTKGKSLSAEWEEVKLQLTLGWSFRLSTSAYFDLQDEKLKREEVLQRLKKKTLALISVSEFMPEPCYLQLIRPDRSSWCLDLKTGAHPGSAATRDGTKSSEKADSILENLSYMDQIVARSPDESREDLKADV